METLVLLLTCTIFGTMAAPTNDVDASAAVSEFVKGNHLFSANLYKQLIKKEKGNFIMSPFSAEIVLALTNEGAFGETSEQLQTGLSLPNSKETTQVAVKNLLPKLRRSEENSKLLTANKIYAAKGVKLNPGFNEIADTVYKAGVENVDFAEKVEAAKSINNWVEEQTNNKIKDLIMPSYLSQDTRLVLVNALYFSGKWVNKFEKYSTKKDKFYQTKDDTKEVDMMSNTDSFRYYENTKLNTKFVELPYEGDNISLIIALPNEIDGLSALEDTIEDLLKPQPLEFKRVEVKLPKFKTETELQLQPILEELGIKKIFTPKANLTGLITAQNENDNKLYVSKVVQKAFIEIDEEGTEAAAATAVIGIVGSSYVPNLPDPVKFYADHPYIYYLQQNNVILFVGKYA